MAPTKRLTWDQVWARRLDRHALAEPVPADRMVAQVAAMCGVHAQVAAAADLSIGIRVAAITRADVRAALWEARTLVKTFGPRGTVHLLAASELATWYGVLESGYEPPSFRADVRLDPRQTDAVVAAIDDALAQADLTLDELDRAVVERAGPWAGDLVMPAFQELWPRWRQAMRAAAFRGVLCFGPDRERRPTYVNPRRWLAGYRAASEDDATRLALRRYLYAYGPAGPEHVARWLGASAAWARAAMRRLGGDLEAVDVDGDQLWQVADDGPPASSPGTVRLLPYFDAYVVGCHPRDRLFPGRAAARGLTRGQAGNVRVLLIDGLAAGIWGQRRSGARIQVTVEPTRALLGRERRAIEGQVVRIAEIEQVEATLVFGTVTGGPHA